MTLCLHFTALAESKEEKCKNQFIGALVWARRLGNAAKLGAQVLMRQPDNSNLFKPTPDFWVSLLHKTLVGPEVLNMKIQLGNRSYVHFFCHCTKPSSKYEKGSFTVFGINLTPNKIRTTFKGLNIKESHNYILLPGFDNSNRMFAETVFLNNKLLTLKNGKEIPEIEPIKVTDKKGVSLNLPSGGIGFWVIPDLKLKACRLQDEKEDSQQTRKKVPHLKKIEKRDSKYDELVNLSKDLKQLLKQDKSDAQQSFTEQDKIDSKIGISPDVDISFKTEISHKPEISHNSETLQNSEISSKIETYPVSEISSKIAISPDLEILSKIEIPRDSEISKVARSPEIEIPPVVEAQADNSKNLESFLIKNQSETEEIVIQKDKINSNVDTPHDDEISKIDTLSDAEISSKLEVPPEPETNLELKTKGKKQNRKSKREARDINSLLNQEMFLLGESNPQLRTIRRPKPENKQAWTEKTITSADEREDSTEDDFGTPDIVEDASVFQENAPPEKVKRKADKNTQGYLKSTEKVPLSAVSPKPETREESSSTEKMSNNKETRERKSYTKRKAEHNFDNFAKNSENYKNLENSFPNSSSTSPKKIRNVFGVLGEALEENNARYRNLGNIPSLDFPNMRPLLPSVNPLLPSINPILPRMTPLLPPLGLLNFRTTETNSKLNKRFQDFFDNLRHPKALPVKRESPFKEFSPMDMLRTMQMEQEYLNLEILRNLREGVDKLKVLRSVDSSFKNPFEGKFKEFMEKGEEQWNNLKLSLRGKREEALNDFGSKPLEIFKRTSENLKSDIEGAKQVIDYLTGAVDADLKKRFSDFVESWQETKESPIKREIKLPKIADFLTIPGMEKSEDECEDECEEVPNGNTEVWNTLTRLFVNHLKKYPYLISQANPVFYDPSESYPPTNEQGLNFLEPYDENLSNLAPNDELQSEEDESWNYKDNRFKRIVRSPKFEPELFLDSRIDENLIKGKTEEKLFRRRRDVEESDLSKRDSESKGTTSKGMNSKGLNTKGSNSKGSNKGGIHSRTSEERVENKNVEEDQTIINFDEGIPNDEEYTKTDKNFEIKTPSEDEEVKKQNKKYDSGHFEVYRNLQSFYPTTLQRTPNMVRFPNSRTFTVPYTNDYFLAPCGDYVRFHRSPPAPMIINKGFGFENPEFNRKFYQPYALEPWLSRKRRQVEDVKMQDVKTTEKTIIDLLSKPNEEKVDKKEVAEDKQEDQDSDELKLREALLNDDLDLNKKKWITKVVDDFDVEDSRSEIEKRMILENLSEDEEVTENTVTDNTQNNLESLLIIDKIYDKFEPSKEHQVHSRKLLPENEEKSSIFEDMTKAIENIFSYFTNVTQAD